MDHWTNPQMIRRAETGQKFRSYADAAKAACAWCNKGKTKVDAKAVKIYTSTVGPYKGRVVGVGLQRNSGVIEDIIRIDNDDTGKGIHFNAKNQSDTSEKLAASIQKTISMKPADRTALYEQYLNALNNIQADTIWVWWKTGAKPTQ